MILAFLGTRGRGKTLSLVKEAYDYYRKGYSIHTNIKLNSDYFKTWHWLTGKQLIDYVKGEKQFKKAFFLLDEVHVYMDSRSGMSNKNKIISYFVLQTRKRNVKLGYTTQFYHQVDKRLRDPTEIKVICNNYQIDSGQMQNNIVYDLCEGKVFQDRFMGSDYFEYYDTNEIVNPFKD